MGGGLAATLTGVKKFTPSGKRYIDYNLVLLALPMMMSGAIVGVLFYIFR
jgi:predicted RND superfamily exporter protein